MNLVEQLEKEKKNPFHFYIISGNSKKNKIEVLSFLEKDLEFSIKGNSEFYQFSGLNLPIIDARKIKSINSRTKNNENQYRIFLIDVKKIDRESQNALLKTLEEPISRTIFFLLVPKVDFLLDTVLSRGRVISGGKNVGSERAKVFLKSSFLEREKMIVKISKSSKEAVEVRDGYLNFLVELEMEILENKNGFLKKISNEEFSEMYKKFLDLKNQAGQRGSGLKYIMTFLAIDLEVLK